MRQKAGLTRDQLADLVGVNKTTVCRWELDQIRMSGPSERLTRLVLKDTLQALKSSPVNTTA